MDRYIAALYEIVTRGRNANSYKFALWRSLARLAPDTDEESPIISKHDLSGLFIEYYWPLEIKFHIRQGIDPRKDPIVMVHIRDLLRDKKINEGESLKVFQQKQPTEYDALREKVARQAFDDVIPRFHIVHGQPIKTKIFTFTGSVGNAGDTIELTRDGREFLLAYGKLVEYVAVSGWVRFTEAFTSAPRLHDKIGGGEPRRGAVWQWRDPLSKIQDGRCFYGDNHDMT